MCFIKVVKKICPSPPTPATLEPSFHSYISRKYVSVKYLHQKASVRVPPPGCVCGGGGGGGGWSFF